MKKNTKATVNYAIELDALRDRMQTALKREFKLVKDNASKAEANGNAYSYLLELGDSKNAKTRFQTWLTARSNGLKIDCFVGTTYIQTGTIIVDSLTEYRKDSDYGCGGSYRNVSEVDLIKFFDSNDLIEAEAETAQQTTEAKQKQTKKRQQTATKQKQTKRQTKKQTEAKKEA